MRSSRVKFADMETEYLQCRSYGHSWDEFTDTDKKASQFGYRVSLRCVRCTASRHDIISIVGDVVQRHYEYPEGYQLAGRPGGGRARIAAAEVRRELYLRRRTQQKARQGRRRSA